MIHPSVNKMWQNYLDSIDDSNNLDNRTYTSWFFCNNEESAHNLAELVKKGIKRGTASLFCLYEIEQEALPTEDCYSIVTDFHGVAQCIIRTKKITILPFKEVDDNLAAIEGEGDQSLKYWQTVHRQFFTEELATFDRVFTEDLLVVFEEFDLVYP
ncbi:ASCH domain-containing protein [Petrocella sp. FN5]|uniref:ASCH domain-containing protein n=1 Tax=Petrocella sp. FN5 TaxID=3032002 RepID=UPI0023D98B26|nr:ASCH domain-containing protein [Petrocella sp. FN5]MDF1617662.1 ASCH domain-containing protein [Petrocella sp. FN5]